MAHHVTCRDAAIWLRLGASVHWPDIANRSLVTPQRTSLGYDFMWQMPRNSRTRLSVELAAHIQQNLICGFTSKGRSIGTTFDKSCEDGIGYLAPLQPVRDNPFPSRYSWWWRRHRLFSAGSHGTVANASDHIDSVHWVHRRCRLAMSLGFGITHRLKIFTACSARRIGSRSR